MTEFESKNQQKKPVWKCLWIDFQDEIEEHYKDDYWIYPSLISTGLPLIVILIFKNVSIHLNFYIGLVIFLLVLLFLYGVFNHIPFVKRSLMKNILLPFHQEKVLLSLTEKYNEENNLHMSEFISHKLIKKLQSIKNTHEMRGALKIFQYPDGKYEIENHFILDILEEELRKKFNDFITSLLKKNEQTLESTLPLREKLEKLYSLKEKVLKSYLVKGDSLRPKID